ncbi:cytochrome b561 [Rhodobacter sp. JA431]|uniref:cytochrome b n=1 Tax=Rhodobacter sp. JA431 TaxID=570013 RepID=UPI000BC5C797|nr:cytochrome b/b6 domain-containing protein [Rhodobacter sp. JA431]SOB91122.1 cytochrome b561 [Rhodobacter sp. JA431]
MSSKTKYAPTQIALHWVIVLLFYFNYFVSEGMGRANYQHNSGQPVTGSVAEWHIPVGLALLGLMILRLFLRLRDGVPAPAQGGDPRFAKLAEALHWAFYALLILGPMAGAASWFFGMRSLGELHGPMMSLAFFLTFAHIGAALYHQFWFKDNLIARMRA